MDNGRKEEKWSTEADAGDETTTKVQPRENELAALIRQALAERGALTVKEFGDVTGFSGELLRSILTDGHIPKDSTLTLIATSLGLEPIRLILAAHRLKIPGGLQVETLPLKPSVSGDREHKRRWPLSQEQCEYLGRVMRTEEIQLIRKMRQLTDLGKQQAVGYLDFMFATCRVPPPRQGATNEDRDEATETAAQPSVGGRAPLDA